MGLIKKIKSKIIKHMRMYNMTKGISYQCLKNTIQQINTETTRKTNLGKKIKLDY